MEKKELTIGQKLIAAMYLKPYMAVADYAPECCMLVDTETMRRELAPMCDIDANALADWLAGEGFFPHFDYKSGLSGWILFTVNKDLL